jgi:2-polyprenyl-3-methyl-5-hydroxy-6-metoxy-1,4-benzoquinol methylase
MIDTLSNRRIVTQEIMDSPGIAEADHVQALAGLRRINQVSGAADHMAAPIVAMARREGLSRLSMLDVACGGGDVPIGIVRAAARQGIHIDLTLLDRSPTAVKQATDAATSAGIAAKGIVADALAELPKIEVDVVSNSLFLHHVSDANQVVCLLRHLRQTARRMVVISDLRRSRVGYAMAWCGCRILSRSKIVHYDGPVSVRAAWTRAELAEFAALAGMDGAQVRNCRPWRMMLVWGGS